MPRSRITLTRAQAEIALIALRSMVDNADHTLDATARADRVAARISELLES